MPYPSVFLVHSVTVLTRVPKQKLLYDGGTAAFTVGKTVKGGTSNATGVIDNKSGTVTSGYLVLITVTGTFQNDETLTEVSGTGAAVVNGTIADYKNSLNQPEYYYLPASTPISARLGSIKGLPGSSAGAQITDSGEVVAYRISMVVPTTTTLTENTNRISTTATGYYGTYEVESFAPVYEATGGIISHYSAVLKKVQT